MYDFFLKNFQQKKQYQRKCDVTKGTFIMKSTKINIPFV